MNRAPLIVIVGPTASGKTSLAIELAKKFNGEIISADSRAIYRGMDIGTAKPTLDEQKQVKHWGIDLINPDEKFTVADFQRYANDKIADIRRRGKPPILVGGSGLYIDAVIFDYEFDDKADEALRQKLNTMTVVELQNYCKNNNIPLPENSKNKRYLVRAIERQSATKNNRQHMRKDAIVVGIETDKDELRQRIQQRAKQMFNGDIVAETKKLAERYSWDSEPMKSNIYPIVWRMINGEITRDEAMKLFETDDWHLAKKQITWFRRNKAIKWLPRDEIITYISGQLNTKVARTTPTVVQWGTEEK